MNKKKSKTKTPLQWIHFVDTADMSWIIAIYIALKPLYLFRSGSLQICDIFLVLSILWIVAKNKFVIHFHFTNESWIRNYIVFIVIVLVVNCSWFIYMILAGKGRKLSFITNSLFYVFNFVAVILCIYVSEREGLKKTIDHACQGVFWSAVITAIGLLLFRGTRLRSTGFFSNPNQLGFYAVIIITFLAFFNDSYTKGQKWFVLIVGVYSSIVSSVCLIRKS